MSEKTVTVTEEWVQKTAAEMFQLELENARLRAELNQLSRFVDHQVREFHLKVGIPAPTGPVELPDERVRYRVRLISEEYLELLGAAFKNSGEPWGRRLREVQQYIELIVDQAPVELRLVPFFDATHDVDYVVAGTRVEFGYDGWPGACEVHRANMAKEGGAFRGDGKLLKPAGWTPPDIAGVLSKQGFVGRYE